MKRYAILIKRPDPYGVGPFDTLELTQAYIKKYLQGVRVEIVSFYEPVLFEVETAR